MYSLSGLNKKVQIFTDCLEPLSPIVAKVKAIFDELDVEYTICQIRQGDCGIAVVGNKLDKSNTDSIVGFILLILETVSYDFYELVDSQAGFVPIFSVSTGAATNDDSIVSLGENAALSACHTLSLEDKELRRRLRDYLDK